MGAPPAATNASWDAAQAAAAPPMRKSPSLFFDMLAEADESKQLEKLRGASIEIDADGGGEIGCGQAARRTPAERAQFWRAASERGSAGGASSSSHQAPSSAGTAATNSKAAQQGHEHEGSGGNAAVLVAAAAPTLPRVPSSGRLPPRPPPCAPPPAEPSPAPAARRRRSGDGSANALTPREVLEELLGDLFVPPERLHISGLLGSGGFAEVHAAELVDAVGGTGISFTQRVAVKHMKADVLADPQDLREFLAEANLLRKMRHAHIVRMLGVGAAALGDLVAMRESMYVVQELMAGGDLKELVASNMADPFHPAYSKAQALEWCLQIAEAMHYLHAVCRPMVIHRDLKLDNVLLTQRRPARAGPDGAVAADDAIAKLADFGLHKRVRRAVEGGALVVWNEDVTYRGAEYEKSFYGGDLYAAAVRAAVVSGGGRDAGIAAAAANGGGGGASDSAAAAFGGSAALAAAAQAVGRGELAESDFVAAALIEGPYCRLPQRGDSNGGVEATPKQQQEAPLLPGSSKGGSSGGGGTVQRKLAAVRALERSVRAGSEYYNNTNATGAASGGNCEVEPAPLPPCGAGGSGRGGSSGGERGGGPLCPVLVDAVMAHSARGSARGSIGSAAAAGADGNASQRFIDATQKVGSLLYMAPEVLQGTAYNERVDVFSFAVIAYELFSGRLLAASAALSLVGADRQQEALLAYAERVARGHREELPHFWPPALRALIADCWAQAPADRPPFSAVMARLYELKRAGAGAALDALRPKGGYNPVGDCGCAIM